MLKGHFDLLPIASHLVQDLLQSTHYKLITPPIGRTANEIKSRSIQCSRFYEYVERRARLGNSTYQPGLNTSGTE